MVVSTKPRIYDLAKALTPEEGDEKTRKHNQAEITKQILSVCLKMGLQLKSASSSIDEAQVEQIVEGLNNTGFKLDAAKVNSDINDIVHNKKTAKTTKSTPKEEVKEEPKKKTLRIIRRIKPGQIADEKEAEQATEKQSITESHSQPQVQKQETVIQKQPVETPDVEPKPVQPTVIEEETKKEYYTQEPSRKKNIPDARILQPYRIARPTMIPSMMGRTKRPSKKRGSNTQEEKVKKEEVAVIERQPSIVTITSSLTVKALAERLSLPEIDVVKALFEKGIIRTVNQSVELEAAVNCAKALGFEVLTEEEKKENLLRADISLEAEEDLKPRPPIVTIMGHVDHGKTTLLDAIREAKFNIAEQEKGGITQHIGAYQVEIVDYDGNKRKITFLDTPGHEAFTAMRARGAQLTDIAILVVAADDGVMPQTIEALDHAKAAGVPIVIALNKIDKPEAQPDRVLGELAEHGLLIEDYGGNTVCSKISAKKRLNLDDLLTKITLVADAELLDKLRANPNTNAVGIVIEAELSKEKGSIAHLLIHNGTLKKGDCLVAGTVAGRVRAMFDDHGKEVEEALPSMPVEVIGLSQVPHAGDVFEVCNSYQEAKNIAEQRHLKDKEKRRALGLLDFASKVREGQAQELKVIIKSDVHGSAEAVAKEVTKLSTNEVLVRPIHIGSGNISESDVNLAGSTDAIIIGFHVGLDANAYKASTELGVDVRLYDIIYKITEDLEKAILGLLEPTKEEVKLGKAEVRQIFTFGKGSKIAGAYVTEGKIQRNQIAKVYRKNAVVFEGKIDNLKRFKDDAKEVQTNFECGISFSSFNDLEEGDVIECWTIIEKERTSLT